MTAQQPALIQDVLEHWTSRATAQREAYDAIAAYLG